MRKFSNHKIIVLTGDSSLQDDISLIDYIKLNGPAIRNHYTEYLSFFEKILQKQLKSNFFRKWDVGLEIWRMSLVFESANFLRSKQLNHLILWLGLRCMMQDLKPNVVECRNLEPMYESLIRDWCDTNALEFEVRHDTEKKVESRKLPISSIPLEILRAFIWVGRYFINRSALIRASRKDKTRHLKDSDCIFINYLSGVRHSVSSRFEFYSPYWSEFSSDKERLFGDRVWIHIWSPSKSLPSSLFARKYIHDVNQAGGERHFFLEDFLTVGCITDFVVNLFYGTILNWRIGMEMYSTPHQNVFWSFFSRDLKTSLCGSTLAENSFYLSAFGELGRYLPKNRCIFYLAEGQGWEFGALSALRRAKKQHAFGVVHSSIRFWDLRFFLPSDYYSNWPEFECLPNSYLVNSVCGKKLLREAGFPEERLMLVEALRYSGLLAFKKTTSKVQIENDLLVVLEIDEDLAFRQLFFLEKVLERLPELKVKVRPHPANPIKLDSWVKGLNLLISDSQSIIWRDIAASKYIFVGPGTTVALEAVFLGKVVVTLDLDDGVTASPLGDMQNAIFVRKADELIDILETGDQLPIDTRDYFYLNEELYRWKQFVGLALENSLQAD